MNAVEFECTITPAGEIEIPRHIARGIPAGEQLRVVVMWRAPDEDAAWRSAGRERFESAYSQEDTVYEQLIDHPPAR